MRELGERVHAAALALAKHGVEDGGVLPGLRRADEEVVHAPDSIVRALPDAAPAARYQFL